MSKMKKKFMALLVVFTSIVSFLPVGFSGVAAKADDMTDATTVRVNVTGQNAALPSRVDPTTKETIYTMADPITPTNEQPDKGFDITVKKVKKSISEWEAQVQGDGTQGKQVIGIVDQKIELVSVNGVPIADTVSLNKLEMKIAELTTGTGLNGEQVIGQRITGLSLGINKIAYKVKVWTQTATYTPTIDSTTGKPTGSGTWKEDSTQEQTSNSNSVMTIEHGTKFVTDKIHSLLYKSYIVGQSGGFDANDNANPNNNNQAPFLYLQPGKPDADMPLRFNFSVPDSTDILKYVMDFDADLNNALIFKNGVQDSDISVANNILQGKLDKIGQSALIVLKVGGATEGNESIRKSYAIEIKYNKCDADQDFSLKDAGITKLDYNDDKNVVAYIGKKFTVDTDSGYPTYNGEITIDPKARMVNLNPTLRRSRDTVEYEVSNTYLDSTNTAKSKPSELINGAQFIDFKAGSANKIKVFVYPASNGKKTSSTPLALYVLDVKSPGSGSAFDMQLEFSNGTYLTQEGVPQNILDKFTTSRRTYDLRLNGLDPTVTPLTVALASASRTSNNEYIKVWLSGDINGGNLKEAQESVNNTPDGNNIRKLGLDVNIGKTTKKMVVQAYYDQIQYEADGTTPKVGTDGKNVYVAHPIGDTYVFYLPDNFDSTDTNPNDGNSNSTNAFLSSIKINGYTLTDENGNQGFSKDKLSYKTTVAKTDTSEKITVTAEDKKPKSIVATIGSQTYDLFSGEENELALDSSGVTTIKIVVTAQDGVTTKTYSVVIKNNAKSNNVNLKNVILNVGDYTFDPKADITKVRVDPNVTSIKVTPIPEESKSKVYVNGEEYSGAPVAVSLKGNQKTEISIEVKSEEGTESKTYTLQVNRVDIADWQDNNNNNNTDRDDQYYDEYNDCWVDLTKYQEWGIVNGKPVYFDNKNRQVKNAWITTGGKTYFLNNVGYRASGWKVDDTNGKTYYLDPKTGEMKTGWINVNNIWYYLELNGVMKKGWLYLNKKWYYFTPNGQMAVNQSLYIDDKVCSFGQDGALI